MARGLGTGSFLAFPPPRFAVSSKPPNTIEALQRQIPQDDQDQRGTSRPKAASKLIYLAIINAQESWRNTYKRRAALLSFKSFGERLR